MYPLWETGELGLENKATQQPLAKPAWQHLRHSSLGFLGEVVVPGIGRTYLPPLSLACRSLLGGIIEDTEGREIPSHQVSPEAWLNSGQLRLAPGSYSVLKPAPRWRLGGGAALRVACAKAICSVSSSRLQPGRAETVQVPG